MRVRPRGARGVRSSWRCFPTPSRSWEMTLGPFVVSSALGQDAVAPPAAPGGQVTHKSHRTVEIAAKNASLWPGNPEC